MTAAVGLALADGEALARAQRSALAVLAIRILGAGLAYATQVLLARTMGRAEYGVFATVWVWVAILGHGSLWGVGQSVCRFVPHHRVREEWDLARGFLAGGAAFVLASAVLTAGIAGGLLWLGRGSVEGAHLWPFSLALAVLPLFALQDYVEGIARSFGWTSLAIAPIYLLRQGLVGAALIAAVAAGWPAEAWVAIACTLTALAASLALQTALLARRLRRELPPGPRRYRLGEWAAASLPIALVDLTTLGLASIDVIMLGLYLPAEAVGVYFAATRIVQFVVFAPYATSAATAQRFADAHAREDRATLTALVTRTARLTWLMTVAAGLGVLAAAPVLLSLFGPGFAASLDVLAILVLGLMVQSAFGPAEDLLNMLGSERACALVSVATLAAAAVLNLALIPAYGVTGAAFAMAACAAGRGFALARVAQARLGLTSHVLGGAVLGNGILENGSQ